MPTKYDVNAGRAISASNSNASAGVLGARYLGTSCNQEFSMARSTYFAVLALTVGACARELPTAPLGTEPLFAKPWGGTSAALSGGFQAATFPVNNEVRGSSNTIALTNIGDYSATIDLENTHASAPGACQTVGDATEALALVGRLKDGVRTRTKFAGQVNLAALSSASWVHETAVAWTEGSRTYFVTIGQTSQSDATFPGVYPTVTPSGSTYTYSGGIVTVRVNYNKTKNASLVCHNLDVVELTYPAP